jgi:hypothetical protein
MKKVLSNRSLLLAELLRSAIVAAAVVLAGCSPETPQAPPEPQIHVENEAELTQIVVDYVRRTKGWRDVDYTVELNSLEGKLLEFWVVRETEEGIVPAPGGDENAFVVLLNPDTKRVEKELGFQ